MSDVEVLDVLYETFQIAVRISLPCLGISLIVGIIVAIFQAATQINEQTMTFVPKLLALLVVLSALGSTDLLMLQEFVRKICGFIAGG